jgi:hypothetical protein
VRKSANRYPIGSAAHHFDSPSTRSGASRTKYRVIGSFTAQARWYVLLGAVSEALLTLGGLLQLQRKVQEILAASAETPELVDALHALSGVMKENSADARRNLKSSIERRGKGSG